MQRSGFGRPCLNIAAGAHLERDAPVTHVSGQATKSHLGQTRGGRVRDVGGECLPGNPDVVDDAYTVTEPVGAAPLDRLPDAGKPEPLARVNGEVGVLSAQVLERVQVPGGRETCLGAGDVEAHNALIAIPHDKLGDL